MPHEPALITTIAAAFGLALILGFVAARLRLPALVGYLLAGIVIGPATPGFVADVELVAAARRDRRDAADVRRGLALLAGRPAGGAPDRAAGRRGADGRRHGAGRAAWRMVWGWSPARGPGVRARAVGREHRGAAARRWKPRRARVRSTAASPSAGWWSRTWRWCWCWCCCRRWRAGSAARPGRDAGAAAGCWSPFLVTTRQGCGLRRADARGRPARVPVAAVAGGAHRLARAVHAVRDRGRGGHRLRRGRAVRRVLRARRLLRRHGAARIGAQPPRGRARRCRCATRSRCCSSCRWACCSTRSMLVEEPLQVLAVVGIIVVGKSLAAFVARAGVPLPAQHRADGLGQPGADRRVLVHPGGPGRRRSGCCPTRGRA